MKLSDSEVIFCDNHLLVAKKRANLLTQPNCSKEPSLEELSKDWVKEKYNKPGNVFLHAVHRLDRPVGGLVLFARTSKALIRLNEAQRKKQIRRIYLAEVEGHLPARSKILKHVLLKKDHRTSIAQLSDKGGKEAFLSYVVIDQKPQTTVVQIELITGRYHQIRAQFSAIGNPIVQDSKYGAKAQRGTPIHLCSAKLSFQHPVAKKDLNFKITPSFFQF